MNLGTLGIPSSIDYADLRLWETPERPLAFSTIFTFPNPAGFTLAFVEPIFTCVSPDGGYVPGDEMRVTYTGTAATDGFTIGVDAATITVSMASAITVPSPKAAPTTATSITASKWTIRCYVAGMAQSGCLSIPFTSRYLQPFRTGEQPFTTTPFAMFFADGPARRPAVLNVLGRCLSADNGFAPGDIASICNAASGGTNRMSVTWGSGGQIVLSFQGTAGVLNIPAGGGSATALAVNKWRFFLTGLA